MKYKKISPKLPVDLKCVQVCWHHCGTTDVVTFSQIKVFWTSTTYPSLTTLASRKIQSTQTVVKFSYSIGSNKKKDYRPVPFSTPEVCSLKEHLHVYFKKCRVPGFIFSKCVRASQHTSLAHIPLPVQS